ncbi:MAG: acetyl-CoA carboxylase, carboxyltransferase subunit beta [Microscillaceae bacterium]|nr:acetyl-CoA carboxylase, carboxyltransferase subunit beta [Microscillaceae bacterium]MDW8460241.1 acetyl-CoA carboxylase, carboxyltransferase subunit beta [Cytophagales bacterium]
MAWFRRQEKGIITPTEQKKETPDGLWHKCDSCKHIMLMREHKQNAYTCLNCGYHARIGSAEYFELLFDDQQFTELDPNISSANPLNFEDTKPYLKRIQQAQETSKLKDALRSAYGTLQGIPITIACMDFAFIGGSMGSVVGEKIARAVDYSIKHKTPFLCISRSGGARMMEAGFSLMQMAKTAAKLALLADAKLPYISLLTDPTTGGVSASYGMLGDLNIAEPNALIGFAGPRVIRETIGKDLPKGFQTAEYLLEHGFLDFIVHRKELKKTLARVLKMLL